MSGTYLSKENLPAGRQAQDISRRLTKDMAPVLFDSSNIKDEEIYYTVYRNLEIIDGKLRYDITEIPSGNTNGEFRKTFGHYHKSYLPEIYEVLEGHAFFLLQNFNEDPATISETYLVEALKGEKVIVPPNFGHLAINIGRNELVTANWIGLSEYDYETYKKLGGGCYYVLDKGASIEFEINKKYTAVPSLKKLKLKKNLPDFGFEKNKEQSILDLKKSPEKLDWLINPEKYKELLTIEKLYREL